jgi:hypothetical protein
MAAPRNREGRGVASELGVKVDMDPKEITRLARALHEAGNEATNSVRHDLKKAGLILQKAIRDITPVYHGSAYKSGKGARRASLEFISAKGNVTTYKGTHTPGLLRRGTQVKTTKQLSVYVYNNAKAVSRKFPRGYRYGKRLEFDPAFAGRFAFFYVGAEHAWNQASAAFNDVLENAHKKFVTWWH